jgi:hypothetical protein
MIGHGLVERAERLRRDGISWPRSIRRWRAAGSLSALTAAALSRGHDVPVRHDGLDNTIVASRNITLDEANGALPAALPGCRVGFGRLHRRRISGGQPHSADKMKNPGCEAVRREAEEDNSPWRQD